MTETGKQFLHEATALQPHPPQPDTVKPTSGITGDPDTVFMHKTVAEAIMKLDTVTISREASLKDALILAFLNGFDKSGQGFNGEYGSSENERKQLAEEYVSTLPILNPEGKVVKACTCCNGGNENSCKDCDDPCKGCRHCPVCT